MMLKKKYGESQHISTQEAVITVFVSTGDIRCLLTSNWLIVGDGNCFHTTEATVSCEYSSVTRLHGLQRCPATADDECGGQSSSFPTFVFLNTPFSYKGIYNFEKTQNGNFIN
jgi:hypothetical protein